MLYAEEETEMKTLENPSLDAAAPEAVAPEGATREATERELFDLYEKIAAVAMRKFSRRCGNGRSAIFRLRPMSLPASPLPS
jgi:hypothetical protein